MSNPVYIFAGGGTGGHLYPALAVRQRLAAIQPQAQVVFACSDRQVDRRVLWAGAHAVVPQPVRPLPRGLGGWWSFAAGWVRSAGLARSLVGDLCPQAVLGLGGFAAAPVVRAAAGAGIRTALLSIDAVGGLANRHLAGKVDVIFAQFASTASCYGRRAGKVRVVGCPVRAELPGGDADEARRAFGLRSDRRTLLVMAGSLGASNINQALAAVRPELEPLAEAWQILHVSGPGKLAAVGADWQGARIGHVAMEYCERMDLAYAVADLALCRAGASTVGELAATGTPAVLVPYPYHRDRHQQHNAAALAQAGAAVVAEDAADTAANAQALRASLLPILHEPDRLGAMRKAAHPAPGHAAAEQIARWLAGKND